MSEIKLPTYNDAYENTERGKPSALDWFIVEHEPAGNPGDRFRKELTEVLKEARTPSITPAQVEAIAERSTGRIYGHALKNDAIFPDADTMKDIISRIIAEELEK